MEERDEWGHVIPNHQGRIICAACAKVPFHFCLPANNAFSFELMEQHMRDCHQFDVREMVEEIRALFRITE